MIYEMCRNFANEELAPNAGEWDQKHAFPTEAITHMVRNDIQRSARGWPQSFIYVITLFTLKEGHARIHAFTFICRVGFIVSCTLFGSIVLI